MSDELVLYHNPMSRGRITHWMMHELGVPFRTVVLSFEKGEHKAPDYLAINPMGKVPAITHRGVVVTECAAICAYLADAFPEAGLAPPPGSPLRGAYYRWLFFGAGCVEPALIDTMLQRPPVEKKMALGYGSYEDTIATLEQALRPGPYLLGEQFTAADLYIGAQLGWAMHFGAPGLKDRPVLVDYVQRLDDRPAAKRAAAIDDAASAPKG